MSFSFRKAQTDLTCSVTNLVMASLPVIGSMLMSKLMHIADRTMLAHFSLEAFNGATVAIQFADVFYLPLLSLASMSEVFVGQMNGQRQFERTHVPILQIILFLTLAWAVIFPFAWTLTPAQIPEALRASGVSYFRVDLASLPIYIVFSTLTAFFVGTRRPNVILPAVLVSNGVNILLDWVLIFGHFGLPAMGALGAALATSVASLAAVVVLALFFVNPYNAENYGTRRITFDAPLLRQHLKIGAPYAFSEFVEMIVWAALTALLAKVSAADLTINNIALVMWTFFMFLTEGFQKGVIALASNAIGAGRAHLLPRLLRSMGKVTFFFAGLSALPFLVFVQSIVSGGFDIHDLELMQPFRIVFFLLWVSMVACVIVHSCLEGILSAGGDTRFVMIIRMTSIAIAAFIIGVCTATNTLSVYVSWWVTICQQVLNGICFYIRYKRGHWRHSLVGPV